MPRLGAGSHLTWVPAGTLVEFGQGDHTTLFSQVLKVALILCPGSINSGQLTLPRAAWGGGGPGVFQAQLPSLCRLDDPDRLS